MHRVVVNADMGTHTINRHVYGQFAEHLGRCIYEGLWVGEDAAIPNTRGWRNDVVAALRELHIPNLRWPGGCFADTYDWKDGIGPRGNRPAMVNVHWGGTTENNHVGTHEFLDLCEQLSTPGRRCEPYIAGNVGSGTVREMAQWLEYITHPGPSPMAALRKQNGRDAPWPLTFWGVGNENWGCGGNMRAEFYADLFRQYQSYCRHSTPGGKLYKVACGLADDWNEVLLREAARFMDGLSVHYYTVPGTWQAKGSATDADVEQWRLTVQKAANIETFVRQTKAIMDRYDPAKRIGLVLDEWGTWFDVEPGTNPGFLYQQNTVRDAVVAGLSLNVFNNHADRLKVANIAQTVNVLQAMILTDGHRMLRTPTYHVFEMFKPHQDATLLPTRVTGATYLPTRPLSGTPGAPGYTNEMEAVAQVSCSASRDAAGAVHLTLVNLHHDEAADIACEFRGTTIKTAAGRVLTGPATNARNTFDTPDAVLPVPFDETSVAGNVLTATLPARSVVVLQVR